jgi:hypothetical protein
MEHKPGRFWGVIGRKNVPFGKEEDREVSAKEPVQIRRLIRRYRWASTPPEKRKFLRKSQLWSQDKYLDLLRQIEELTGETAEAQRRYSERLKNLTVFPNGGYTVQTSDSSVITRHYPENPPKASSNEQPKQQSKGTRWEDSCGVEKCLIKAGFDKNGEPYYKMGYDVVRKKIEVPNN